MLESCQVDYRSFFDIKGRRVEGRLRLDEDREQYPRRRVGNGPTVRLSAASGRGAFGMSCERANVVEE